LGITWLYGPAPKVCVPGASQKVVPAGLALVRSLRFCWVLTVTAPAGAVAGPDNAAALPQTRAVGLAGP
jgi:hypothetical protein